MPCRWKRVKYNCAIERHEKWRVSERLSCRESDSSYTKRHHKTNVDGKEFGVASTMLGAISCILSQKAATAFNYEPASSKSFLTTSHRKLAYYYYYVSMLTTSSTLEKLYCTDLEVYKLHIL